MIAERVASDVIHSARRGLPQNCDQMEYDDFVARALELCEIAHHATLGYFSIPQAHDPTQRRVDVLSPNATEEKLALIIRMDGCLSRWRSSLAPHLRHETGDDLKNEVFSRQTTVLHLR